MTATLTRPPTIDDDLDGSGTAPPGRRRALAGPPRGRLGRLVLGSPDDARWVRPSLLGLLVATAALYLVGLTASGYANEFYAAAVQAGTKSWTAWLFGSLDSANSITVDKPPASLWIMVLSARILGFSSFSLLLPQALMGVATVGVTYSAVRRWAGAGAGLVAGLLVALTPVAALMFRFDNPDAFLVLMMTLAGYGVVRAVDATHEVDGKAGARRAVRWLVLAGLAIGIAFLTKMFQGLLVLPAFALVYLVAAKLDLRRRVLHLLTALGAVIVGAGWFVALVALWPAGARPYIGGSTNNSLWELAIGYNGLGRIFGGSGNGGGGGGSGSSNTGFGGSTGITRLFNTAFGTEISWFIPAALVGLVAVLLLGRKAVRTDRTRAGLILWGGSLVISALVFSFMEGTVHPYYAVALAPSLAATVAIAGAYLWRRRDVLVSRLVLAAMIVVTSAWSFYLLQTQAAAWLPALRYVVLIGGVLGAAGLVASTGKLRRFAVVALLVGAISAGAGSGAWTVATAASAHSGSIPTSGPSGYSSSGMGGMGGGGSMGGGGTPPSGGQGGPGSSTTSGTTGTTSGTSASAATSSGTTSSSATSSGSTTSATGSTSGTSTTGTATDATGSQTAGGGGSSSSSELTALLSKTTSTWSAAVIGSQTAAGYELSSDTAVMAIGGWDGSDPSITLAQFQADVAAGKISYFIAGGQGGGGQSGQSGSTTVASQITTWVEANYTATTVGGATVYDLTAS